MGEGEEGVGNRAVVLGRRVGEEEEEVRELLWEGGR